MIPKECKRLAEVDFPIAVVSKHAAREKSIRHGHPSTLHLWWARRPLAACRAMLLALLLPDPCDPHCPGDFKAAARELLARVQGVGPSDADLRDALLKFIGDFAAWELSTNATYLAVGRGLVMAAHEEEPPLVVDPFAGGGSISLEALRLGCDAFASDLNPVACLILKVMLEDIPRYGPELAEEVRRVGGEIKRQAERELAKFYPKDPDGATPIAYLWARTVRCEAPNCGAEIPLVRSFWLCKKPKRRRALRYAIVRAEGDTPRVEFEIFEPKADREVPAGTVARARATCPACGAALPAERVRAQLAARRGGADPVFDATGNRIGGARLLAVVTVKPGEQGRCYRLPAEGDYEAVRKAQARLAEILYEWERSGKKGLCPVPDEPTPALHGHRSVGAPRLYGMTQWGDLFSQRQKLALVTLCTKVASLTVGEAREVAGLAVSRLSDICNAFCRWENTRTQVRNLFTRHDLPMTWDFAEASLFAGQAGDYTTTLVTVMRVVERLSGAIGIGQVQQADAVCSPLPDSAASVWFTDPPYYDSVAYADLSDFFFVWLRRALPEHRLWRDPRGANNPLTPKRSELTATTSDGNAGQRKTQAFFENGIRRAFGEGNRLLRDDGIGSVVFAHKTTEGWEALLSGLTQAGWTINGSWPIATELGNRLNARDAAALATSVHLVCRRRPEDAPVGNWADVLRELPSRAADWMDRLQREGIRGADLVFACIGPALEIYSRYKHVETAEGRQVQLSEYLEKVWEAVGRAALRQVLGTDAPNEIEEDARLTALFLWTARSSNGFSSNHKGAVLPSAGEEEGSDEDESEEGEEPRSRAKEGILLPYDIVRRFAQPLGIHLDRWEGNLIEAYKGVVRLLPVPERLEKLIGKPTLRELRRLAEAGAQEEATQLSLFDFEPQPRDPSADERVRLARERVEKETWAHLHRDSDTLLCHVHRAMLFQRQGMTAALRELLFREMTYRPEFLRLANALSALYPPASEEKRLLDAMLLAMPK
ncbi:MAG: DUF1156 domain-containing protein [bacterium]|jgi:adenine-specific DNA methylase|nr:DUF1156 domain-containing protein [bacterium]